MVLFTAVFHVGQKPSANLAEGASPSGGFGRDRQQQQDEKEGDAARELQTRVLELEEEVRAGRVDGCGNVMRGFCCSCCCCCW